MLLVLMVTEDGQLMVMQELVPMPSDAFGALIVAPFPAYEPLFPEEKAAGFPDE